MFNGFVYYEGVSQLDFSTQIVCIVTGNTKNQKTGDMLQTWIINRDVNPIEANRLGLDVGICGDCVHKGIPNESKDKGTADNRSCYVLLLGVSQIYKSYQNGKYDQYDPKIHDEYFKQNVVRMGSYGEMAALPLDKIKHLAKISAGHTAYTHAWKKKPKLKKFMMASVDSEKQAREAQAKGWRTFRILKPLELPLLNEIECPASEEFFKKRGKKYTCEQCQLCCGQEVKGKSITISAHGVGKVYINKEVS